MEFRRSSVVLLFHKPIEREIEKRDKTGHCPKSALPQRWINETPYTYTPNGGSFPAHSPQGRQSVLCEYLQYSKTHHRCFLHPSTIRSGKLYIYTAGHVFHFSNTEISRFFFQIDRMLLEDKKKKRNTSDVDGQGNEVRK